MIVATTNGLAGYRITQHPGLVRGATEMPAFGSAVKAEKLSA